jgi:hypothetical protein
LVLPIALVFASFRLGQARTSASPSGAVTVGESSRGVSAVPWKTWFEKNTTLTEKHGYIHIFWNAQEARSYLEGKEKKRRIAEAARHLVTLLYPNGLQDRVRIDIVFVLERDQYGMPKWDSLQRVAHLELSKARLLQAGSGKRDAEIPPSAFEKFEVYP